MVWNFYNPKIINLDLAVEAPHLNTLKKVIGNLAYGRFQ